MLGCGLRPNTSMHAIEELVEPPYLFGPPLSYQLVLDDGRVLQRDERELLAFRGKQEVVEKVQDYLFAELKKYVEE